MSMDNTDSLFTLIKSLTKSEKRYFKIRVAYVGATKNYVRLFDAIDRMEQYDESRIREEFSGENFIRQLHVTKRYLFKQILRILDLYNTENDEEWKIHTMVREARILHEKGLIRESRKTLERAEALAEKKYDYTGMLEVLKLRVEQMLVEPSVQEITELYAKRKKYIRRIERYYQAEQCSQYMYTYVLCGVNVRTPEERNTIDEMVAALPKLARNDDDKRFISLQYYIWAIYFHIKDDPGESIQWLEKRIKLMESQPELIINNISAYIGILSNLGTSYNAMFKSPMMFVESLKKIPELLRGYKQCKPRFEAIAFVYRVGLESYWLVNRGDFEVAIPLIDIIEKGMSKYSNHLTPVEELSMNVMKVQILFGNGEYRKALEALNTIADFRNNEVREMFDIGMRCMRLIIYYELGELELLSHQVKSVYRHVSKKADRYSFESTLLSYLRKIWRVRDPSEIDHILITLRKELEAYVNDVFQRPGMSFFKYLAWIDSKIEKKPFAEIVKRHSIERKKDVSTSSG